MKKSFVITIVFLIICSLISSILIYTANNQVLNNAKMLGEEIAENLVNLEEESYIRNYKELLNSLAEEINTSNHFDLQDMNEIYSKYQKVIRYDQIDIYIVKEGKLYLYKNTVQESNLDYEQTQWYIKAKESKGEMISTDVYNNESTGERIVTFAMMENNQDVIAINLYIDKIENWPSIQSLPDGARYYICDSKGNIIHAEMSGLTLEENQTNEYINKLLYNIKNNQEEEGKSYTIDVTRRKKRSILC